MIESLFFEVHFGKYSIIWVHSVHSNMCVWHTILCVPHIILVCIIKRDIKRPHHQLNVYSDCLWQRSRSNFTLSPFYIDNHKASTTWMKERSYFISFRVLHNWTHPVSLGTVTSSGTCQRDIWRQKTLPFTTKALVLNWWKFNAMEKEGSTRK